MRYLFFLFLLTPVFLFSQTGTNSKKTLNLTLKEAVQRVLDTNLTVKNALFEIEKSESAYEKNLSQFAWKFVAEASKMETKLPFNNNNIFSGTKIQNDKLSAGFEKQFETGTFLGFEVSTLRFDANAFETYSTPSSFSFLAVKPLYTGAFTVKMSQELWKYSFGKTEENKQKMLKKQAEIMRESLINQLTNLVTVTLVDYWSLSVYDSSVVTYEKLLENSENVRKITARKLAIGTAERFELNQWNAIVNNVESQLEKAKLDRDDAKRRMRRILGIEPDVEISGITDLAEVMPEGYDLDKDLEYAYNNRIDLKILEKQIETAVLSNKNAEAEDELSIKANASYSSRSQTLISPQENYFNYQNGIASYKYPEIRADITISKPLWDEGVKTTIRDSKIVIQQLQEERNSLRKEIRDELTNRLDEIRTSHQVFLSAKQNEEETAKYYNGLLSRYLMGKYSAIALKNALDSYVQAQMISIQSKINFNVNLIRYDLTRNSIFARFGIDVYKILDELKKEAASRRN